MLSYLNVIESQLFIQSPIPQVVLDPINDVIEGANSRAIDLFLDETETLTGRAFSHFFGNHFDKLIAFTQAVIEQGHYWSTELSIVNSSNQKQHSLEVNASVIDESDTPKLHLYLQDINEIDRKRATAAAHKHYLSGLGHWKRVERFFEEVERDNQLILNAAGEGIYGVEPKAALHLLIRWRNNCLVGVHKS